MEEPPESPLLNRIRNMWEFVAIVQFLYLFYDMFNLDDFDVEVFEEELLGIKEPTLISLTRLRLVQGLSSNRAITAENLDEFARKQYLKRKPDANPFGDEENPTSWNELDVFAQIRVLRQLCTWQLVNPERFRERANIKDSEQLSWRVDPCGYDADGNIYYLFDDNRLYRRDAPVIPEDDKPQRRIKYRGKKRKRTVRRIESEEPESPPNGEINGTTDEDSTWHVVCVTMDDWTEFLAKMKRSKNLDEKALYRHLNDNVLPRLIEEEKEREKQRFIREQEYLKAQAFAARKRSSRLVQREEDKKIQAEREEELAKLRAEEEERKKEHLRLKKLEQEREARLQLREQRQRERELRIQQREEEKRRLAEEAETNETPIKITLKTSASPTPVKKTPRQRALDEQKGVTVVEPPKSEESWFFDCICGQHGTNFDDGTYTVACEKCDIWQHVACLPDARDREELLLRKDAPEGEYPDYEFICSRCRKKAKEEAKAEAVKTKEQLRKEKERAANRAKYERRKARDKARKEEERRKREEEARLGITTLPDGTVIHNPIVNGPMPGFASSSPAGSISPESRIPTSAMPMAQAARYHPPQGNLPSTGPPYQNAPMRPLPHPQFIHYPYPASVQHQPTPQQASKNQPPPPQPQQFHTPNGPPPQASRPPYTHIPYQPQQHVAAGQPQRPAPFPPVRPPVAPYWSTYTTSPNLPNGHHFPQNPPQHLPQHPSQSSPYANGAPSTAPASRNIAIKPAPPPIRPTPPTTNISPTPPSIQPSPSPAQPHQSPPQLSNSPQQRVSQTPAAIQPRPPKSPELQRKSLQSGMSINQPLAPRPSPNIAPAPTVAPSQPIPSSTPAASTEMGQSQTSQPSVQLPSVQAPPHPVSDQSQPLPVANPIPNGVVQSVNNAKEVEPQVRKEENVKPVVNGVTSDGGDGNTKSDKGTEKIKMAFLVN